MALQPTGQRPVPVGQELPRDEVSVCGIGLEPLGTWMAEDGEGGAQGGVHVRRVGFLEEAGWHVEPQERREQMRNFPENNIAPQTLSFAIQMLGILFFVRQGVYGPNWWFLNQAQPPDHLGNSVTL